MTTTINELIQRLSAGKYEVMLEDRNNSYEDIKRHIESGFVHIGSTTTINYNAIRCIADIDLATRIGEGCLKVVEESGLVAIKG